MAGLGDKILETLQAAGSFASNMGSFVDSIEREEGDLVFQSKKHEIDRQLADADARIRSNVGPDGLYLNVDDWAAYWNQGVVNSKNESLFAEGAEPDAWIADIDNRYAKIALMDYYQSKKESYRQFYVESAVDWKRKNSVTLLRGSIDEKLSNDTYTVQQKSTMISEDLSRMQALLPPDQFAEYSRNISFAVAADVLADAARLGAKGAKDRGLGLDSVGEAIRSALKFQPPSVTVGGTVVQLTPEMKEAAYNDAMKAELQDHQISEAARADGIQQFQDGFKSKLFLPASDKLNSFEVVGPDGKKVLQPGLYELRALLKGENPSGLSQDTKAFVWNAKARYGEAAMAMLDEVESRIHELETAQLKDAGDSRPATAVRRDMYDEALRLFVDNTPYEGIKAELAKQFFGRNGYSESVLTVLKGVEDWMGKESDDNSAIQAAMGRIGQTFKKDTARRDAAIAALVIAIKRGNGEKRLTGDEVTQITDSLIKPEAEKAMKDYVANATSGLYGAFTGGNEDWARYTQTMGGKASAETIAKHEAWIVQLRDALSVVPELSAVSKTGWTVDDDRGQLLFTSSDGNARASVYLDRDGQTILFDAVTRDGKKIFGQRLMTDQKERAAIPVREAIAKADDATAQAAKALASVGSTSVQPARDAMFASAIQSIGALDPEIVSRMGGADPAVQAALFALSKLESLRNPDGKTLAVALSMASRGQYSREAAAFIQSLAKTPPATKTPRSTKPTGTQE